MPNIKISKRNDTHWNENIKVLNFLLEKVQTYTNA